MNSGQAIENFGQAISAHAALYKGRFFIACTSPLFLLCAGDSTGRQAKACLLISMLGKLCWFCSTSLITMFLLMWKWMGLFLRKKNHLLRCWDWPSLLNWIGILISIAKTASKKIGALIHSMKSLSPAVALYLYKSTINPCME